MLIEEYWQNIDILGPETARLIHRRHQLENIRCLPPLDKYSARPPSRLREYEKSYADVFQSLISKYQNFSLMPFIHSRLFRSRDRKKLL